MFKLHFVVARYDADNYQDFLMPYVQTLGIDTEHIREGTSLCNKYNQAVDTLKPTKDDIVIFIHADTRIRDQYFKEKIELLFSKKDIGVLGICGTRHLGEKCAWWLNSPHMAGGLIQHMDGKVYPHKFGDIGYFEDMVVVDGFCFMVRGDLFEKIRFDEQTFTGYDMYEIDFCMQARAAGYKVAVADILIEHGSAGKGFYAQSWADAKNKFVDKWITQRGLKFPITGETFGTFYASNKPNEG